MKFFVTFRYKSYYENEKENKIVDNQTLEYQEIKITDQFDKVLWHEKN